jgi:hypothetical protein
LRPTPRHGRSRPAGRGAGHASPTCWLGCRADSGAPAGAISQPHRSLRTHLAALPGACRSGSGGQRAPAVGEPSAGHSAAPTLADRRRRTDGHRRWHPGVLAALGR